MRDVPDIAVKVLPDISPGAARDTRARAWSYVFDVWNRKADEPAPESVGRDDAKEAKHGAATASLTK
jgi:hypothetical protein